MKNKLYLCFAALLLTALCGCEKVIEFNGEVTEPRLTLSSQAEVGKPLTAYLASSIFFLADNKGGAAFTEGLDTLRGQVRCFVNGENRVRTFSLVPGVTPTALCYVADDYVPAPGDHIRIEAEFPGFNPVWAETDMLQLPNFEVVSLEWKPMDMGEEWDWMEEEDGYTSYDASLTLAVIDDASYDKYYFLQPIIQFRNYWMEEDILQTWSFTSNDIIFRETAGVNESQLLENSSNYFSDKMVKGKRYEFTISMTWLPSWDEITHMWVEVATVDEALYWYDKSFIQASSGLNGIFSEGVSLYSNVNGGYGVFCSKTPLWLEVER